MTSGHERRAARGFVAPPRSVRGRVLCGLALALMVAGCAVRDWSSFGEGVARADAGPTAIVTDGAARDGDAEVAVQTDAGDAYGVAVQTDGPVAWYRFEDADTATSAADSAGSHPGALGPGAVLGEPGVVGHAVHLQGKGGIDLGNAFGFAGPVSFTLEAWVKATDVGRDQSLFEKRYPSTSSGFLGYIAYLSSTLSPHFEGWGAALGCYVETRPFATDRFVHVAVVVSYATGKGNASIYVDGQALACDPNDTTTSLPDTPQPLVIGGSLAGWIDEVAIYDKALPAARIQAHTRAGTGH